MVSGPSRLDAVFHAVGQVEIPVHRRQQRVHLTGGQGGERAAAHVERLDPQARLLHHAARGLHLRRQRLQIRLHQLKGLFHRRGHEAAIGAAGWGRRGCRYTGDVLRGAGRSWPSGPPGRSPAPGGARRGRRSTYPAAPGPTWAGSCRPPAWSAPAWPGGCPSARPSWASRR